MDELKGVLESDMRIDDMGWCVINQVQCHRNENNYYYYTLRNIYWLYWYQDSQWYPYGKFRSVQAAINNSILLDEDD